MRDRRISGFLCHFVCVLLLVEILFGIDLSFYRIAKRAEVSVFTAWPANLALIEEDAFDNTSFEVVRLPGSLQEIGDRAFADISNLYVLYVSSNTVRIGNDVIKGSSNATIAGEKDSFISRWARTNHIPFSAVMKITALSGEKETAGLKDSSIIIKRKETVQILPDAYNVDHARRTGRTIGELKSSHFKGRAAQHVQSRYFP